jgi:hypothetical protein
MKTVAKRIVANRLTRATLVIKTSSQYPYSWVTEFSEEVNTSDANYNPNRQRKQLDAPNQHPVGSGYRRIVGQVI